MAIKSIPSGTNFALEVQKGTDKNGEPTYATKTFSGVNESASNENIFAVADAISNVLANSTRDCFVNKKAALVQE